MMSQSKNNTLEIMDLNSQSVEILSCHTIQNIASRSNYDSLLMLLNEDKDVKNVYGVDENYERRVDVVGTIMRSDDKQYQNPPSMDHLFKDIGDDESLSNGHEHKEEEGLTKPLPLYVPMLSHVSYVN